MNRKVNIDRELDKLIKFLEWKQMLGDEILVFYPEELYIINALLVLRHLKNNISNTEFIEKRLK